MVSPPPSLTKKQTLSSILRAPLHEDKKECLIFSVSFNLKADCKWTPPLDFLLININININRQEIVWVIFSCKWAAIQ